MNIFGKMLHGRKAGRTAVFFFLCSALSLLAVPHAYAGGSAANTSLPSAGGTEKIWFIPVEGDIEPSLAAFVRRETGKALQAGASCLVFEIDTFGGRVDTALQIASFIMSVKNARTVAWVRSGENSMGVSWSAGALIALSCGGIYMAPGTSMGAAAPVTAGADGTMESAGEKTVSAVRSQMAALAERNGYPVGIALAMVDHDVELWEVSVNGEIRALTLNELENLERDGGAQIERRQIISAPGKLLSLSSGEALRYGLASALAVDKESLLEVLGIRGEIVESSPVFADTLISFLTSGAVQTILIILGLVMIFLEINTPGFGIFGVVAIIAFLAVFGPGFLLGRVDSLEIILFVVGLALLAVELFIIPGFGLVGILGFILIGFSLLFSMQDFVVPRFDWEWDLLSRNALVVFAGLVASITGIAVIALMGPKIRIFDRLTLKAQITGTAGGSLTSGGLLSDDNDEEDYAALAGKIGVADSTLRPSGRAVFDGKVYTVEADGEFVDPGRGIIVTRVRGNRITVRRV
jgi:membrane-bound serine protease (ClpP class)